MHCRAVARGARRAFLVGDLPFGSYETGARDAIKVGAGALLLGSCWAACWLHTWHMGTTLPSDVCTPAGLACGLDGCHGPCGHVPHFSRLRRSAAFVLCMTVPPSCVAPRPATPRCMPGPTMQLTATARKPPATARRCSCSTGRCAPHIIKNVHLMCTSCAPHMHLMHLICSAPLTGSRAPCLGHRQRCACSRRAAWMP